MTVCRPRAAVNDDIPVGVTRRLQKIGLRTNQVTKIIFYAMQVMTSAHDLRQKEWLILARRWHCIKEAPNFNFLKRNT